MPAIREMHGLSLLPNGKRTVEHTLWLAIRNKCNNSKAHDYKYYGARGIQVCARWDRFTLFLEDVGFRPSPNLTLDRINVDGDYEPGNVRWATRQTQARNRNYCMLSVEKAEEVRRLYAGGPRSGGLKQTVLAEMFGVSQGCISQVILGKTWVVS